MRHSKKLLLLGACMLTCLCSSAQSTVTDSQGIVYNILTAPSEGQPGTCAVGDNLNYSGKTDIIIPASVIDNGNIYNVTQIEDNAFGSQNNPSIANKTISTVDLTQCQYLQTIGLAAFAGCDALTSVDLTGCEALKTLNNYVFYGDAKLTTVDFSGCSSLATIGNSVFYECSALTSVEGLSNNTSLTTIGLSAFYQCTSLQEIDLSGCSSLSNIKLSAMSYCNSLTSINLTGCSSLATLGVTAFSENPALVSVIGLSDCTGLTTIPSGLFYNCYALQEVDLSGLTNLQSIGANAFYNCSKLTSVDLSNCTQLTAIEKTAFNNCERLASVGDLSKCTLLQSIGDRAFYTCRDIKSIDLSGCPQFTSIGSQAFNGCWELSEVILPASLTTIGYQAFDGCKTLLEVTCYAKDVPTFQTSTNSSDNYLFSEPMTTTGTLYVPKESIDSYQADQYWGKASKIESVPAVLVSSLSLEPDDVTLALNAPAFTFESVIAPDNADNKTLEWSTSDDRVATVDDNGQLTLVGTGSCTITAKTQDGSDISATANVTVTAAIAESIEFDFDESVTGGVEGLTLEVGDTYTFTVKATTPEGAVLPDLTWNSTNDMVASVSAEGEVTAIMTGTTTITASATVNGLNVEASCEVTVVPQAVTSITLSSTTLTLEEGAEQTLSVESYEPSTAEPEFEWSSTTPGIVEIVPGDESTYVTIKALAEGTTNVKVAAGDVTAECVVTVSKTTGIVSLFDDTDADTVIDVYDLQGRFIVRLTSDNASILKPGLYVMRRGDVSRKVLVK